MFDYTTLHWITFLIATVLLHLTPGADMAFVLGHTTKSGKSTGFSAMFGILSGGFIHVFMAAIGLSAIIATSAIAFTMIKFIGAAYLIWLGISALRSHNKNLEASKNNTPPTKSSIFIQGFIVATLNPKVAIFFLAFLPQFVVESAGPLWAQFLLHGTLIIAIDALILPPLILASASIAKRLQTKKITSLLNKILGTLFIALGLRLAISET